MSIRRAPTSPNVAVKPIPFADRKLDASVAWIRQHQLQESVMLGFSQRFEVAAATSPLSRARLQETSGRKSRCH